MSSCTLLYPSYSSLPRTPQPFPIKPPSSLAAETTTLLNHLSYSFSRCHAAHTQVECYLHRRSATDDPIPSLRHHSAARSSSIITPARPRATQEDVKKAEKHDDAHLTGTAVDATRSRDDGVMPPATPGPNPHDTMG